MSSMALTCADLSSSPGVLSHLRISGNGLVDPDLGGFQAGGMEAQWG